MCTKFLRITPAEGAETVTCDYLPSTPGPSRRHEGLCRRIGEIESYLKNCMSYQFMDPTKQGLLSSKNALRSPVAYKNSGKWVCGNVALLPSGSIIAQRRKDEVHVSWYARASSKKHNESQHLRCLAPCNHWTRTRGRCC